MSLVGKAESIDLSNRVTIEITTSSYRTTRGYTVCAGVCEEVSFWHDDESSRNPAKEILNAIRPAMATIPNAMLLAIGTPVGAPVRCTTHARSTGETRMPPDILVFRAPTRRMNPLISQAHVEWALEVDPAAVSAEYLAEFRSDIETFVRREAVETCLVNGRYELLRNTHVDHVGGTDLAGGGGDEYGQTIAHAETREGRTIAVLDCLVSFKPPCPPEEVVKEFAAVLHQYGVQETWADAYAGEWPREHFHKCGIDYRLVDKSKSDLYRELLPAVNSGLVELLDHPRLIAQLCNLERKVSRGGQDTIDHPPGGHDDLVNAAAIALVMAIRRANRMPLRLIDTGYDPISPDEVQRRADEEAAWKREQGMLRMQEVLSRQGYHFPGD